MGKNLDRWIEEATASIEDAKKHREDLLKLKEDAKKGRLVLPENYVVAEIISWYSVIFTCNKYIPADGRERPYFAVVPKELGKKVTCSISLEGVIFSGNKRWQRGDFYTGSPSEEEAVKYFFDNCKDGLFPDLN